MKKKRRSKLPPTINMANYEDLVKGLLVDLSTIVDTDLGCIGYMMYHYPNSKYFMEECKSWSLYFTKCKILTRKDINPLTVILKDDYIDQADNLYNELLDNKWEEIVYKSPITDVMNLLYTTYNYAGYEVTVKCRNEIEEKYIKEKGPPNWKTLIGKENPNTYSTFFIHDLHQRAEDLSGIGGKGIYIYYHNPNFLNFKQGLLKEDAAKIMVNNIKLIEPYKGMVLPYDMTPDDMEVSLHGKEYSTKRDQSCDERSERETASQSTVKSTEDL